MEIKIGVAKTNKYAVSHSGDSVEFAERPQGGVTLVLADGQGSGRSAKNTSSLVVNKAVALIADGARDGAVARAVHDYLYALKDGKVSSTLTLLSADLDAELLLISRNSNCPVIVKDQYGIHLYDETVNPIGVHKRTKPLMYQLPLEPETILVSYTDGIPSAGRKKGRQVDQQKILQIIAECESTDVEFIADSILNCALQVDDDRPGDDMTVVVMAVSPTQYTEKIRRIKVSFPY